MTEIPSTMTTDNGHEMTSERTKKGAPKGGTKIPRKDMYIPPLHYHIPHPHFFHPASVPSRCQQVERQINEPFFLLLFLANNKPSFPAQSGLGLAVGSTTPRAGKRTNPVWSEGRYQSKWK